DAARVGLADPELREVAVTCFTAALDALPRLGADDGVTEAVAAYRDRHVARGRCPADDTLDRLRATAAAARTTHPHGKDSPS
ncbi:ergothioneine biosynthesis glutamate--cysteine ligase EgtA, partial [Streptomyces sp. NPDC090114]